MNFNLTGKKDYQLCARHTNELINLYGVPVKLMLTEKINYDSTVFGDYSSVKVNKDSIFELMMMPENSDEWDDIGVNFSDFGMLNVENIRLFVSSKSVRKIFEKADGSFDPIKGLQNNLLILPNSRIMEITDVNFQVPGINNLYTSKDDKNVYKITLRTYHSKTHDDLTDLTKIDDEVTDETYNQLDGYFDELINNKDVIDNEAEFTVDIDTEKPVLVKPLDEVFGRF